MQNAESSLSVGFTSLRDGKALWLILTPKDGGTMQAHTMHTPCTYHAHTMFIPCTYHAAHHAGAH